MMIVRLAGGLGNQLFQLAAAAALRAEQEPVLVSTRALGRYAAKRQPDSLSLVQASWLIADLPSTGLMWLADRARVGRWLPRVGVNDRTFAVRLRCVNGSRRILDGYFQEGWTSTRLETAIGSLNFRAVNDGTRSFLADDECAVHIRGGDFLELPAYRVVNTDYYASAIDLAATQGWRKFVVITDDPSHAAQVMNSATLTRSMLQWRFAKLGRSTLEDFDVLRSARARVIGNSTFAWWATALDVNRATTWTPDRFVRSTPRTFFMDWEVVLPCDQVT
jgi:hypothetical protein